MIRSVIALVTTFFVTIYSATVVIVAKLLGRPTRPNSVYERAMQRWAGALIRGAGVKVVLHGEENITAGGGVYICNHVSWFDVFAIASKLPRCTFVAKHELRGIPIFGWGAESAGVVFLDRENRKAAFESYKVAAQAVQAGSRIVVFPEGTRGEDYHLRTFKKGPFVLARDTHKFNLGYEFFESRRGLTIKDMGWACRALYNIGPAGTTAVYSGKTWHAGTVNCSDQVRKGLNVNFVPARPLATLKRNPFDACALYAEAYEPLSHLLDPALLNAGAHALSG